MNTGSSLKKVLTKAEQVFERGVDKRVRIAVTGLSRSGKTAFITSLINQLVNIADNPHLPFFAPARDGYILAAKQSTYDELHVPEFNYKQNLNCLYAAAPQWPASTTGVSQAQLKIRYKVRNEWWKKVQKQSHLTLDIVDYPGEWLLDLPLLRVDFKSWSLQCLQLLELQEISSTDNWFSEAQQIVYRKPLSEEAIRSLAEGYRSFIKDAVSEHQTYNLLQPGRFILPGELAGAPVLDFFPVLDQDILNSDWQELPADSLLKTLEKRFNYYKEQVVRPFFKEYFATVDRQILLVDCLEVLNKGYTNYQNMQLTLLELLRSFHYGQSNWVKRIFNPSIDKLLIAVTKADHVPPEQHRPLEAFLHAMLQEARNDIQYHGITLETMTISSIRATEAVLAEHQGQQLMCVKGTELETGEPVINYPGKIPDRRLTKEQWQALEFNFVDFAVPQSLQPPVLPHIRMDKVLQFLIGDKFR